MKTKKLIIGVVVILSCISQDLFGVILLRRDPNTDSSTINFVLSTKTAQRTAQQSALPVTADLIDQEIGVFFNLPVGNVTVSIEDIFGNVIDSTTFNSDINTEYYLPIDGYEPGEYVLKVNYGTTKLIGNFSL